MSSSHSAKKPGSRSACQSTRAGDGATRRLIRTLLYQRYRCTGNGSRLRRCGLEYMVDNTARHLHRTIGDISPPSTVRRQPVSLCQERRSCAGDERVFSAAIARSKFDDGGYQSDDVVTQRLLFEAARDFIGLRRRISVGQPREHFTSDTMHEAGPRRPCWPPPLYVPKTDVLRRPVHRDPANFRNHRKRVRQCRARTLHDARTDGCGSRQIKQSPTRIPHKSDHGLVVKRRRSGMGHVSARIAALTRRQCRNIAARDGFRRHETFAGAHHYVILWTKYRLDIKIEEIDGASSVSQPQTSRALQPSSMRSPTFHSASDQIQELDLNPIKAGGARLHHR